MRAPFWLRSSRMRTNGFFFTVHRLVSMSGPSVGGRWPCRVVSDGSGGNGFRLGFGLVKEIVARVRLPSGPG